MPWAECRTRRALALLTVLMAGLRVRTAGDTDTRLPLPVVYDGGWFEWSGDPANPIEVGAEEDEAVA